MQQGSISKGFSAAARENVRLFSAVEWGMPECYSDATRDMLECYTDIVGYCAIARGMPEGL